MADDLKSASTEELEQAVIAGERRVELLEAGDVSNSEEPHTGHRLDIDRARTALARIKAELSRRKAATDDKLWESLGMTSSEALGVVNRSGD